MTINATFQSFSVLATRLSAGERPTTSSATSAPAAPTTPSTTAATADTVTLSGAAQTEQAPTTEPAPTTGQEGTDAPSPTSLFSALDADEDGSMTKEEFTSGALALLGRRGDHPRVHGNGDGDNGRRARGVPGLERRLEKAFDRVDANQDGGIDEGELDAALSRAGDSGAATGETVPPPSQTEQPQAGATFTFTSVTYVSVAVQRYTSLQEAAPAAPPSPAAEPDAA